MNGLWLAVFGGSPPAGTPTSTSSGARNSAEDDAPPTGGSATTAFVAKSRSVITAPFTGEPPPAKPSYTTLPRPTSTLAGVVVTGASPSAVSDATFTYDVPAVEPLCTTASNVTVPTAPVPSVPIRTLSRWPASVADEAMFAPS